MLFDVSPADPAVLSRQLAALLAERPAAAVVVCEVSGLVRPGPADLDRLARLGLTARRAGRTVALRGAGPRLRLLLALTGLDDLLAPEPARPPASDRVGLGGSGSGSGGGSGESPGQPP